MMSSNLKTALGALGVVAFMGGLAAASPTLYDVFCDVTGFGGTVSRAEQGPGGATGRMVTVRFDANVRGMPLKFGPKQVSQEAEAGVNQLAFYTVTNTSDQPVRAIASYNVTPYKMGPYFEKLECFCFEETVFQPGETYNLPVTYFVDGAMVDDYRVDDVRTMTLSYTFHLSTGDAAIDTAAKGDIAPGGG